MSKIDKLIQEYCPNGVEYVPLGHLGTIKRGNGLQKKDFVDSGIGCIHYGQIYTKYGTFADKTLTYVKEDLAAHLLSIEKGDLVIACTSENVEDVCKAVAWLGDDVIVTGGHSCVFHHNQNPKYIAYFFQTEFFQQQKRKYAYGTKVIDVKSDNIAKILIPLPPLPIQEEIVRILDTFTELETELEAELEARLLQYQHYRDQLFRFDGRKDIKSKKLGDVCDIKRGIRVVKKQLKEDGAYPVFQNSIPPMGYYDQYNREGNMPYIICAGSSSGSVGYCSSPFWAADDCYTIEGGEVNNRYAFHFLKQSNHKLFSQVRNGSMPRLPHTAIDNMVIPIPSLEEQERIATILDRFDTLVNDLSQGLPAEIEARRQQYEYYRNKLLNFKKK